MFSYLLGFNEMCAEFSPMELVKCFNSVFTIFDAIVDKHKVFKVETLGDAVYMIAGGVPDRRPDHASCAAKVALDLVEAINIYKLPTKHTQKLHIRMGKHVLLLSVDTFNGAFLRYAYRKRCGRCCR